MEEARTRLLRVLNDINGWSLDKLRARIGI